MITIALSKGRIFDETVPLLTTVPAAARADVTETLVTALRGAGSRWREARGLPDGGELVERGRGDEQPVADAARLDDGLGGLLRCQDSGDVGVHGRAGVEPAQATRPG